VLADQPAPRMLVLGDMAEVGENGLLWHGEVGAYARECGIESLLAFGPLSAETVKAFGAGGEHFDSIEALCSEAISRCVGQVSVLVKGSRSMRMERVVAAVGKTVRTNKSSAASREAH